MRFKVGQQVQDLETGRILTIIDIFDIQTIQVIKFNNYTMVSVDGLLNAINNGKASMDKYNVETLLEEYYLNINE